MAIDADNDVCIQVEAFYALPEPPVPTSTHPPPDVPLIGQLTATLLSSRKVLFFILYNTPGTSISKWSLVRMDIRQSMSLNPNNMQDGQFLVNFYICHPGDVY